jgi:hypothetical protein
MMCSGHTEGPGDDRADELLLADLRRIAADADPPPALLVDAGRAAFALRALVTEPAGVPEVAELTNDSAVDAGVRIMRGQAASRTLAFATADGRVEVVLQVDDLGPRRRLLGQLTGAAAAQVTVEYGAGAGTDMTTADDLGLFEVGGIEAGPVRITCVTAGGATVTTSWTTI